MDQVIDFVVCAAKPHTPQNRNPLRLSFCVAHIVRATFNFRIGSKHYLKLTGKKIIYR